MYNRMTFADERRFSTSGRSLVGDLISLCSVGFPTSIKFLSTYRIQDSETETAVHTLHAG